MKTPLDLVSPVNDRLQGKMNLAIAIILLLYGLMLFPLLKQWFIWERFLDEKKEQSEQYNIEMERHRQNVISDSLKALQKEAWRDSLMMVRANELHRATVTLRAITRAFDSIKTAGK